MVAKYILIFVTVAAVDAGNISPLGYSALASPLEYTDRYTSPLAFSAGYDHAAPFAYPSGYKHAAPLAYSPGIHATPVHAYADGPILTKSYVAPAVTTSYTTVTKSVAPAIAKGPVTSYTVGYGNPAPLAYSPYIHTPFSIPFGYGDGHSLDYGHIY